MTRIDGLTLLSPPGYLAALDLLEAVAPAPLKASHAAEWKARKRRRAEWVRWCQREARRVEMISRAGRSPGNNER